MQTESFPLTTLGSLSLSLSVRWGMFFKCGVSAVCHVLSWWLRRARRLGWPLPCRRAWQAWTLPWRMSGSSCVAATSTWTPCPGCQRSRSESRHQVFQEPQHYRLHWYVHIISYIGQQTFPVIIILIIFLDPSFKCTAFNALFSWVIGDGLYFYDMAPCTCYSDNFNYSPFLKWSVWSGYLMTRIIRTR